MNIQEVNNFIFENETADRIANGALHGARCGSCLQQIVNSCPGLEDSENLG
jgi:hypothetical protein